MKIYIAGMITGDPDYKTKFEYAKKKHEDAGHIVLNPADLPAGMANRDYMRICFAMIDTADLVVFLPGWSNSRGAKLENEYCQYISKQIMYQDEELKDYTRVIIEHLPKGYFGCLSCGTMYNSSIGECPTCKIKRRKEKND
jgi:hypothetical protein